MHFISSSFSSILTPKMRPINFNSISMQMVFHLKSATQIRTNVEFLIFWDTPAELSSNLLFKTNNFQD